MNAQLLAALGEQVQKAIAAAADPLLGRIKELEARPSYDGSDIRSEIKALRDGWDGIKKSIPEPVEPYDDTALRQVIEEFRTHTKSLEESDARHWGFITTLGSCSLELEDRVKSLESKPSPSDGKNALDIEILPAIDEAKSYTRGTYAKHAGGLWRAYEQTHEMRGWECIVDGVAAVYPSIEGKSFKMTVRSSSGCERYAEAMIPVQVYKGVWSEGDYLSGDTATWAGSLWHCNKDGTSAKPGDGSGDWTLAVKKGRDASAPVSIK